MNNNAGARFAGKVRINSLAIGLTIIVVAMGAILLFQTIALNKLQVQSDQNNKIISQIQGLEKTQVKNASIRTDQINSLNRHLDCIVTFFSNPDRSQTAIADIDTCTLQDIKTGTTTTTNPISTPSSATKPSTSSPSTQGIVIPIQNYTTPNSGGSTSIGSTGGSTGDPSGTGSTNPIGGTSSPSFLDKTLVTPLNNNIVQPVKNLLNDIL